MLERGNYMSCLDFFWKLGGSKLAAGQIVLYWPYGCAYTHFGRCRVNFCKGGVRVKVDVTSSRVANSGIAEWNVGRFGGGGAKSKKGGWNQFIGFNQIITILMSVVVIPTHHLPHIMLSWHPPWGLKRVYDAIFPVFSWLHSLLFPLDTPYMWYQQYHPLCNHQGKVPVPWAGNFDQPSLVSTAFSAIFFLRALISLRGNLLSPTRFFVSCSNGGVVGWQCLELAHHSLCDSLVCHCKQR